MTEFFPVKALVGYDYSKIFSEGSLLESNIKEEYEDYFIINDFTSLINQMQSSSRRYHNNYYEHIISIGGVLYTYSSYLGAPGTFNTSNIVYKVPIGLLDLPDTREQLQYTSHNKSTIEEIIKNLRIKYYKQKEEELKILVLSVKNEDILTQLQVYSEFSASHGFNLVSILNHSSVAQDLVVPEELKFKTNSTYVQLLTERLSCRHISRNYNNSAFNSNSKGSFYVSYVESTPNFVCIINDLKKLPLSQLDFLDEEYKRDTYIRVDIDQNSNIDFNKFISFFNTLILPYHPNARVIKASELFSEEVYNRYKDNKPARVVVNTSTTSNSQTIRPLTNYRTIECTGKNTSQDFKYSNLNTIEHNGSDIFDKSYAKHFKGIIIFGFNGPDDYIGTLNNLTNFAHTYSKTVTYFRCTKNISSEIEKEFLTAFEDNEDCFVFNPRTFANSLNLLSYINPTLIDPNIGKEYLSVLYMEYNLSWDYKKLFIEHAIKDSQLYPIANEFILELFQEYQEVNPSQDMSKYFVSLNQILNKFNQRLAFNTNTNQIVTRILSHSGYCMIEESRIPALAREILQRNSLSSAYLNGREYTIKDYILDCIPSISTQEVQNEH